MLKIDEMANFLNLYESHGFLTLFPRSQSSCAMPNITECVYFSSVCQRSTFKMAASILNVDEMFNNRIWHVYQGNFSTYAIVL